MVSYWASTPSVRSQSLVSTGTPYYLGILVSTCRSLPHTTILQFSYVGLFVPILTCRSDLLACAPWETKRSLRTSVCQICWHSDRFTSELTSCCPLDRRTITGISTSMPRCDAKFTTIKKAPYQTVSAMYHLRPVCLKNNSVRLRTMSWTVNKYVSNFQCHGKPRSWQISKLIMHGKRQSVPLYNNSTVESFETVS